MEVESRQGKGTKPSRRRAAALTPEKSPGRANGAAPPAAQSSCAGQHAGALPKSQKGVKSARLDPSLLEEQPTPGV
jgi:hypothetical protein